MTPTIRALCERYLEEYTTAPHAYATAATHALLIPLFGWMPMGAMAVHVRGLLDAAQAFAAAGKESNNAVSRMG